MKNESIEKIVSDIDKTLRLNGHLTTAERLEELRKQLEDPESSLDALKKISSMCHIKWMGDLYISNVGYHEWLHTLNALRTACQAAAVNKVTATANQRSGHD
jgi:hypothetical protein